MTTSFPTSVDPLTVPDRSRALGLTDPQHGQHHQNIVDTTKVIERMLVGPTWFNVKSDVFGAVGDGVANDTAAIQAAGNAVATGGRLEFGPGVFMCSGPLSFPAANGMIWRGAGRKATTLRYTGTGSASFLQMQSAINCGFEDMHIEYTNAGFTGALVDFGKSGVVPVQNKMRNVDLVGVAGSAFSSRALIDFAGGVGLSLYDVRMLDAVLGVQGATASQGICNIVRMYGGLLQRLSGGGLLNMQQGILLSGVVAEPLADGTPTKFLAYDSNVAANQVQGVTLQGCWGGDITAAGSWLDWAGRGLTLSGCRLSLNQTGCSIINFTNTQAAWDGIAIHGGALSIGVTTTSILNSNSHTSNRVSFLGVSVFGTYPTLVESGGAAPTHYVWQDGTGAFVSV